MSKIYQKNILKGKINSKKRFIYIFLIIIGPAILIGIRDKYVGIDTANNWDGYLSLANSNSIVSAFTEYDYDRPLFFIFKYFNYLIFKENVTMYLINLAFITLYILVYALDKIKEKISIPLALFIYYSFLSMQLLNQSRQMLALSIVFLGIIYIKDRKIKKYILIILIATLIHPSAIVTIFFAFLNFENKKNYLIKKRIYTLFYIISPFCIGFILKIISKFINGKYGAYVQEVSMSGIGMGLILNIMPIFIPIIIFRKYFVNKEYKYLLRISILSLLFRLLGYYSYFLMRMYYYSAIPIIIIIPLILKNIKTRNRKILYLIFIYTIFLFYYIVNYMYLNVSGVFPYLSI